MTHHAFTNLPPDARARLHRLIEMGAKTPYVRERIEEEFGLPMPDYPGAYRGYAAENGLPWYPSEGISYPVAALLDPERPWRETLRELVRRRYPYHAMLRSLLAAGAPLTLYSYRTIRSAIAAAGWKYKPHGRGGVWGRPKPALSRCPQCGATVRHYNNTYCNRACYAAHRKEATTCKRQSYPAP